MSSCGTPLPEPGIGCGKTSGRDGWQVGAPKTRDCAGAGGGAGRVARPAHRPPPLWAPDTGFLRPGLGGEGCSHHPRWTGSERPRSPRSVFARAGPGGGCGLRPARADSLAGRCAPGVEPAWGLPGESFLSGRFSWAGPGSAAIHPL